MKKPAPFACVCVLMFATAFQPLFAQSDTPIVEIETDTGYVHSFREMADSAFMHLNFSDITTGILADKGLPFGKPYLHNGQLHEDNYANTYDWYGNFALFSTGSLNDNTFFPNKDTLYSQINTLLDKDTVPIGMMLIDYHAMDTHALANGLFEMIDGQLYDDPNRVASPYQLHRAFIAAPLKLMADSGLVTFLLPSYLLMNNTPQTITQITCEIDGATYTIYAGQVFSHVFTTVGEAVLLFTIYLNDGSSYRIRAMMNILHKGPVTAPDEHFMLTATRSYNGVTATGRVSIRYGCGNSRVRKPLIIVEGWDPPELRRFGMPNTSFNTVTQSLPPLLLDQLQLESYDIIFLDYTDGATYIQANAYLLEELIKLVNNRKQEGLELGLYSEPNIIVGFSMGALVTRYALLDMENRNEQHDTRTYFSVDGPHQGAYVPVGIQMATKRLLYNGIFGTTIGEWIPQIKWADDILERPASKQMANYQAYYYDAQIPGFGVIRIPTMSFLPTAFVSLQSEFSSMGYYPSQSRNIAISSGSENALGQFGFGANDKILDYNTGISAIFGSTGSVIVYVLTGLSFEMNAEIYALPDYGQGKRIVYKDHFEKGTFWSYVSQRYEYKIETTKPLEICPGGYVQMDMYNLPRLGNVGATLHKNRYTFIPTISSLDISYPENQDVFYNVANNNIIANNKTRFKSYQPATLNAIGSYDANNNKHATLAQNSNNNTNAIEILNETVGLLTFIPNAILPFGVNLTSDYNYGRNHQIGNFVSSNTKLKSATINNGATLNINTNTSVGYNNLGLNSPSNETNFRVYVEGSTCLSPGIVDVLNGGVLEIGNNNTQVGELIFMENSVLELASGSNLNVLNNSKVIFERDAVLVYNNGATINLSGANSQIVLLPGAIIAVPAGNVFDFTGDGFIKCYTSSHNFSRFEGDGSIELVGSGKNDKVIEFEKLGMNVMLVTITTTIGGFKVNQGKFVSNADIALNRTCEMSNAKIEFNNADLITNSDFHTTNTDITASNIYFNSNTDCNGGIITGDCFATNISASNDKLKLNAVQFNTLDGNGLYVYNSRNELSNLTFTSQDKPMRFYAMSFPTVLDRVLIHNHANVGTPTSGGRGIVYEGASNGSELHLKRTNVLLQNMNGITVDNAQLSLECSKVTGNSGLTATHGIILSNGASLIADPSIVNNAGKNDLSGYKNTILCDDALDIQIHNGYTSLAASVEDAFEGNILTEYVPNTDQFLAHYNHWKWNGAPSRTNHYYTFKDGANRQFGLGGNVSVDGSNYLTAIPNLDNLCPETNQGGGGSGGDKHSGYVMNNPTLLAAKHHELNLNSSYETLLDRVFNPTLNLTHTARIDAATELLKRPVSNDATMKTATLLVYQKMLNHHAALLAQNSIPFGKSSPELDQLLNTQLQLMSNTTWSNDQRFKLEMDKVFTYRASGNLSWAMIELNALAGKYENKATYINKWTCTLQNEIDLKSGNLSVQEFVNRTNQCSTSYAQSTHLFNKPNESTNEILNTIGDVIKIYPNPAHRHLSLKLDGEMKETLRIEIKDMLGKTVMTKDCKVENSLITMSIEQLPVGIYILVCDEISLQTKFSVVK